MIIKKNQNFKRKRHDLYNVLKSKKIDNDLYKKKSRSLNRKNINNDFSKFSSIEFNNNY